MLRCKACAVPVPKSQERRLLESSQSEQVRSTLEVSFTRIMVAVKFVWPAGLGSI